MLEELAVEYKWIRVPARELRSPGFMALNPNGKMPVIQDGALILFESMAINLYLAQKYGIEKRALWPSQLEQCALVYQWSFWAVNEIEPDIVAALAAREKPIPEDGRRLDAPLQVLDRALESRSFLLGEEVTAADINVAGILSSITATKFSLEKYKHIQRWLRCCLARPYPRQFFRMESGALS